MYLTLAKACAVRSHDPSTSISLFSTCFSSRGSASEASESMSKSAGLPSLSSSETSPFSGYASWNAKTPIVMMEDRRCEWDEGKERRSGGEVKKGSAELERKPEG